MLIGLCQSWARSAASSVLKLPNFPTQLFRPGEIHFGFPDRWSCLAPKLQCCKVAMLQPGGFSLHLLLLQLLLLLRFLQFSFQFLWRGCGEPLKAKWCSDHGLLETEAPPALWHYYSLRMYIRGPWFWFLILISLFIILVGWRKCAWRFEWQFPARKNVRPGSLKAHLCLSVTLACGS